MLEGGSVLAKCMRGRRLVISHMSLFANNALLGGRVRVRVWIREHRNKGDQRHY